MYRHTCIYSLIFSTDVSLSDRPQVSCVSRAERKGKVLCSRHSELIKDNRGQLWLLSGLRTEVLYLLKQLEGEDALVKGQKCL